MEYHKEVALGMVKQMQNYEQRIESATKNISSTNYYGWSDSQSNRCQGLVGQILSDVKNGESVIMNYREHLTEKIRGLD